MSRFVRSSKYRHVYGTASKRDQCYDNLKVSRNAWDSNLVSVNPLFVAVNWEASGGGAFALIPHDTVGKLPENYPLVLGHTAAVLDTAFNPFNDYMVASGSEDSKAMIWTIPKDGLKENLTTPAVVLDGHSRKVGNVSFHPTAENVLVTAGADLLVKFWDITTGQDVLTLNGHTEIIQSFSFNQSGSLLVTTCKDKIVRVYDIRSNKVVHETSGHQGIKGSRVVWLGGLDKVLTTGYSKTSDRQVYIWDTKNMSQPLKQENVDTASGMLMPNYDADTGILYLAGKGDGNIRYYEWVDDETNLYYLSEYKSSDPQRGIGFLPKRAVNVSEVEVARAYKVHPTLVEPISFRVPRKGDGFQSDLYPDCIAPEPIVTAKDFFLGKVLKEPKRISLQGGFQAIHKDFSPAPSNRTSMLVDVKVPTNEKEYQDAYHSLKKENDDLKNQVTQKEIRIRQLEAQLEGLMKK